MSSSKYVKILIRKVLSWAVLALLLGAVPAGAQSDTNTAAPATATASKAGQSAQSVPSIPVNVVPVLAIVRDKKGRIVPNLKLNDFVLTQDGNSQAISYFAEPADIPLFVGLLVDTSLSQRGILDNERVASGPFFDHTIREGMDQGFVIHFDHQIELLQDMTTSPQKLEHGVSLLQISQPPQLSRTSQGGGPANDPNQFPGPYPERRRGGDFRHSGTQLYDAVYLASHDLMNKQSGRKALVIISDGVDRGSKETQEYALETAQRSNTVLYCVYFKGEEQENYQRRRHIGFGGPGMGPMGGGGMGRPGGRRYPEEESHVDGKKILDQMAKATGGRMFEISKKLPLNKIYDQIQEELRSQYILGFTPASSAAGYHKTQLTTRKKGLIVQARDGYYSAD